MMQIKRETGCAVNVDGDFVYYVLKDKEITLQNAVKEFDAFVALYTGKGVSDILLNCFCQNSITPTRVWTARSAAYLRKQEDGIPVDYRDNEMLRVPYQLESLGFDPFAYCFAKFQAAGLRSWLSIRMNDCHFGGEPTSWIRSNFYYEAKQKGWLIGPKEYGDYFGHCFDYAVPQVRQKMLDYIAEQLDRYDVYGLELDFSREICCFDFRHNPDCCDIMTDFCRQVKDILKTSEKKYSHPLKLLLRTARDLSTAKAYGFDVLRLARERLVDIVSPAPRFITSDSGMPVEEWVAALSPYGVKVYPALESMNLDFMTATPETVRGLAVQYFDQGGDKIYLYNAYHYSLWFPQKAYESIWNAACDPERQRDGLRRHIVTFQDDMLHAVETPWHPLPRGFVSEISQELITGYIEPDAHCTLYVGVQPISMELQAFLNGVQLTPIPIDGDKDAFILNGVRWNAADLGDDRKNHKEIRAFSVPATLFDHTLRHTFTFSAAYGSITYLELKINGSQRL